MIHTALGYDGSVRIKADLSHSAFDQGLSYMTGKVQNFGNTLKRLATIVGVAFGTAAIVNFGKAAISATSALNDAWIGLQSIVEGQGKSFSKAKSFINEYISDGLVPLENAVTAYKNLAARGYTTEQIEKVMTALKDAAAFGRQSSYSLGEAVSSATEGLKNENSILVDNAGVTKNVAKMWQEYAKEIGVSYTALTQEQKIQAEVNGILEETRFQTGDAAKLVSTYSGQIALLGYNFQNLKIQVGEALIPIAQAVLPGINAIISALTKLATVFSQVTALLFGKSAELTATDGISSSASAAADATDALADATEEAGDASEEAASKMKGVLSGFDELNILADNAASSTSDAADGLDVGAIDIPSYESEIEDTNQLSDAFEHLGEVFIKALDDMLAAIPGFRAALLEFAGNFNEFNQKLYEGFTFDGVKERIQQLGTDLAAAFNDLVLAINWELWGRTLGSGLNLGLQFLVNFLYEFDWIALGDKLAKFINGIVYEVDWKAFGQFLWKQFKIGLETFAGFFIGLDMPALAQAASNTVIGFFNSMQETIANIDWAAIGRQVAEFLNNIDWAGVITAISGALREMVRAGLETVGGFISSADPDTLLIAAAFLGSKLLGGIVNKVILPFAKQIASSLIGEIGKQIAASEVGSLISSIGTAIGGIATTLAGIGTIIGGVVLAATSFFSMWEDGFSWAKEAVMLLGIALTAVGAIILGAPALVAGVIAGIVAAVATLVILVKDHAAEIGEAFSNAGAFIYDHFIAPVGEFFDFLGEAILEFASNAAANIQSFFVGLPNWFDETFVQPIEEFFSSLGENITSWASETVSNIEEFWSGVGPWFNETIVQPVTQFFSDMWSGITQRAKDTWDSIVSAFQSAGAWFEQNVTGPLGEAFNAAVEVAKGAVNGLIGNVEGMINAVIKAVNWLISQLNKIKFSIPDWVPAIGGKSFGFSIPSVSEVKLPRLANGAVIPPNQQFAAILGDQRSGVNVETPLKTIEQALRNVMSETGMSGVINITVESILDGKVVARNTVKHINSMTRSTGRSPLYT